jgi:hypothetical protein
VASDRSLKHVHHGAESALFLAKEGAEGKGSDPGQRESIPELSQDLSL